MNDQMKRARELSGIVSARPTHSEEEGETLLVEEALRVSEHADTVELERVRALCGIGPSRPTFTK